MAEKTKSVASDPVLKFAKEQSDRMFQAVADQQAHQQQMLQATTDAVLSIMQRSPKGGERP